MAYSTREKRAAYAIKRYRERISLAKDLLGNKCFHCGKLEELELDHINPSTKKYSFDHAVGLRLETFLEEVKKCQLLCKRCHTQKSISDAGKNVIINQKTGEIVLHGTPTSYKHCKCSLCKEAKSVYGRNYKLRKKINKNKSASVG